MTKRFLTKIDQSLLDWNKIHMYLMEIPAWWIVGMIVTEPTRTNKYKWYGMRSVLKKIPLL
jgi:hypothetical protein